MTENTGFEFDINPDTDEKYIINDLNRTKFDSSPLGQSQFQQNIKDEQIGELAETEFKNVELIKSSGIQGLVTDPKAKK